MDLLIKRRDVSCSGRERVASMLLRRMDSRSSSARRMHPALRGLRFLGIVAAGVPLSRDLMLVEYHDQPP